MATPRRLSFVPTLKSTPQVPSYPTLFTAHIASRNTYRGELTDPFDFACKLVDNAFVKAELGPSFWRCTPHLVLWDNTSQLHAGYMLAFINKCVETSVWDCKPRNCQQPSGLLCSRYQIAILERAGILQFWMAWSIGGSTTTTSRSAPPHGVV
jgi:hypothetical protein